MKELKQRIAGFLFLAAGLLAAGGAHATGSLRELRQLSFGHIAVTGAAPQTVTMSPAGVESASGGITLLMPRGENGIYQLTGYAPNTSLWITIAQASMDRQAGGASLTLDNFIFSPDCTMATPCSTDGAGELTVGIGATLTTQPATSYGPGPYRAAYDLLLNF